MKSFKIQVNVPADALFALEFSQDKTSRRILELLTIDLFNQDRISSEKAAEILEVGNRLGRQLPSSPRRAGQGFFSLLDPRIGRNLRGRFLVS